jgi:hypothetical protein
MTAEAKRDVRPKALSEVLADLAAERIAKARQRREELSPEARRRKLREDWERLLGNMTSRSQPQLTFTGKTESLPSGISIERFAIETEPGLVVPVLLLLPRRQKQAPAPVVIALAQSGKEGFLRERPREIAALLAGGVAVCLPDVRGVGETRAGDDRGRQSADTTLSSTELMLGGTMVGARLRDLRTLLNHLRQRQDVDRQRLALWGDSFGKANSPDTNCQVPHGVDDRPGQSEPLGGLMALLGALTDEKVAAVYVQGGLVSFQSVLSSPFVYVPHDVVIPGALTISDLGDVAASLAPRPLCVCGLVDHFNRRAAPEPSHAAFEIAVQAYRQAGKWEAFSLGTDAPEPARWLLEQLARPR